MDQQAGFQETRYFAHHFIGMLVHPVGWLRIEADAGINIILQTQWLPFVPEIPNQGVKIIEFVVKRDAEFLGKKVGHFIKAFQTAIFIDYSFNKAIVGVEYGAHMIWFRGSGIETFIRP